MEFDLPPPRGRHHRTFYFQGRKHVIFVGRMMRSLRVYPSADSFACHREIFYRNWE